MSIYLNAEPNSQWPIMMIIIRFFVHLRAYFRALKPRLAWHNSMPQQLLHESFVLKLSSKPILLFQIRTWGAWSLYKQNFTKKIHKLINIKQIINNLTYLLMLDNYANRHVMTLVKNYEHTMWQPLPILTHIIFI